MVAPFFKAAFAERHQVVATFAIVQVLAHLVKIVLFGLVGLSFAEHAALIAIGAAGVTVGAVVGTKLLDRLSERAFTWLFRGSVTLACARLLLLG